MLQEYEFHPEAKCADANGEPCGRQSKGQLTRRHVLIDNLRFIGKESNRLEEVEDGGFPDSGDVFTEYPDPQRDEWETKWRPMLESISARDLAKLGIARATVYAVRKGRGPFGSTRMKIIAALTILESGR